MNNETLIHLGGRMKISPKRIIMLKADENYTVVYLEDGSVFITAITMGILENRLKEFYFFRPNRSVLVNLNFMVSYEKVTAQIKMENNEIFKISRRRAKLFDISENKKVFFGLKLNY